MKSSYHGNCSLKVFFNFLTVEFMLFFCFSSCTCFLITYFDFFVGFGLYFCVLYFFIFMVLHFLVLYF